MGLKLGIEDPEQWLEECPKRVFDNWRAAYATEPFGNETELLTRVVSLLYLIAAKGHKLESVIKASDKIMEAMMPAGWTNLAVMSSDSTLQNFDAEETMRALNAQAAILGKVFG